MQAGSPEEPCSRREVEKTGAAVERREEANHRSGHEEELAAVKEATPHQPACEETKPQKEGNLERPQRFARVVTKSAD